MRSALGGIPVSRVMLRDFRTLSPEDSVARAVDLTLAGWQQDFPVLEDGRIVGVLMRGDLLAALAKGGTAALVRFVMRGDVGVVDSSEMIEAAFARLQACECHTIPVVHEGRLVGLVTMENIGEFVRIQSALGRTAASASIALSRRGGYS